MSQEAASAPALHFTWSFVYPAPFFLYLETIPYGPGEGRDRIKTG